MGGSFSARSFDLARPGVAPVTVLDCSSTSTETEEHRPKLYAFRYDPASLRMVDGIPATKHHSGITAIGGGANYTASVWRINNCSN